MNVFAFIAMVIAAIIFLFVPTATAVERGWKWWDSIRIGLFFLTVGLIIQFAAKEHTFTF
jgi:hypothetical protein